MGKYKSVGNVKIDYNRKSKGLGTLALPKGDGVHSYMVYEDGVFTTKDMDGAVLETLDIRR